MTNIEPHLFWITSRTAGVSAMVLASISVGLGLAMAARLGGGRLADRRVLHEALSIGVMISIVVHAGSLLFDNYLSPSIADVTIPFVTDYKTYWTALGIVSGWGMILFGLAYYARRHIGAQRWKLVHRFTLVTWIGGLIHSIGEGTDASRVWFLALMALTVAPSLTLAALRLSRSSQATPTPRPATRSTLIP
jgi:sulfoxide reductase heme-binding subunit YedZ